MREETRTVGVGVGIAWVGFKGENLLVIRQGITYIRGEEKRKNPDERETAAGGCQTQWTAQQPIKTDSMQQTDARQPQSQGRTVGGRKQGVGAENRHLIPVIETILVRVGKLGVGSEVILQRINQIVA